MSLVRKVFIYIFSILAVVAFICMISTNEESPYWWQIPTISLAVFILSLIAVDILYSPYGLISVIYGIAFVYYVWYLRRFKRSSKEYRQVVKIFGRKPKYHDVYYYGVESYLESLEEDDDEA